MPKLKTTWKQYQDEGYSIEKKLLQRNETNKASKNIKNYRKFSIQEKSINSTSSNNENQLP